MRMGAMGSGADVVPFCLDDFDEGWAAMMMMRQRACVWACVGGRGRVSGLGGGEWVVDVGN